MAASENDLEKRLAQLKKQVPTRGLERHPLVLKNVADLPAELQSPAVASLAAGEAIQIIIAFPPQIHRGWHYVPKQALLFTPMDVIHLQASIWPDQEPQTTHLKGSGLMYMKVIFEGQRRPGLARAVDSTRRAVAGPPGRGVIDVLQLRH